MMDEELGRKVDSVDESPLLEIKEYLDSPHPALEGQSQFGSYQIDDDTLSELEQQIDFVDSQTFKNNYLNPDSFTQNYDATVGSRGGRAKFRLNQAFTGNRKLATDLNEKIDIIFRRLPGRTDANPKRKVNAVLLRSGKHLILRAIEINNTEKHAVVEEASESRSRPIILDDPNTESEIPREKERPNTGKEAIDLEEEEGGLEEDFEIDRQERTNVDRQTTVNIDRHSGNNVDRLSTPAEPAIERVYRTLPPFPPNKTQTKRELDRAICKKAFDKITLEMPLSDAIKVSPSIKKYVTDMVSNSFPAAEQDTDRSEYDDQNTDKPSSVITQLPHMHAVRSLRSDRALPKRRYDISPCILVYPSMLSPEDRSGPISCFPPF
ncbi:hypothetical protein F2Q70_00001179 [Brassica cretica]|uniref:Uncharacterized protein n=1 Tax=Brassica cretica TaxID=69181 RepID=A0A8S9IUJ4_BRACR|nr:hypothetical protein F2Q70_00001179 [Brassica cretica]